MHTNSPKQQELLMKLRIKKEAAEGKYFSSIRDNLNFPCSLTGIFHLAALISDFWLLI